MRVTYNHSGYGRIFAAAVFMLLATSCSSMKSVPATFDLAAPGNFPSSTQAPRAQLIVQDATAVGVLDSEKIVIRPAEGEVATLPDAQWIDRLTRLVQARTVQTFENSRRLRSVGRPGDRIAADYQLVMDIRSFEIVANGPVAEVTIAAKVVGDRSGRIVAGRVFQARVPATATQGTAAVAALDEAWSRVVVDMVMWASRII